MRHTILTIVLLMVVFIPVAGCTTSEQAKEWLDNRLYKIIKRSLGRFLDPPVDLEFVILEKPP